MKAIRNILTKISWGTFKPVDLVFPNDVVRGDVHLCDDDAGRVIVMDEISVRAMLHRVGPLCAVKVDQTTISVDAWAMAEAIDQRSEPIHQPISQCKPFTSFSEVYTRDIGAHSRLRQVHTRAGTTRNARAGDAARFLKVRSTMFTMVDARSLEAEEEQKRLESLRFP